MGRNYCENRESVTKGEVYFIQCGNLYKIGAAKNVYTRLIGLQTANPTECTLVHRIKTNNMYLTERLFKCQFNRVNMRGEWFTLSEEDIAYIKAGKYSRAIVNSIGNTKEWNKIPDIAV